MDEEEFDKAKDELEAAKRRTRAVTEESMARVMARMSILCSESENLQQINDVAKTMIELKEHLDETGQ